MGSGRPSGPLWLIIITIGSLVLLCLLAALGLRGTRPLSLPVSEGMPAPAPGVVVVQVVPTAVPLVEVVPTRQIVPDSVQPAQPTSAPISPQGNDTGVQPNTDSDSYVDGNSVEPYPDDGSGNANSGTNTGRVAVACNRRVAHVVRRGENLYRIALRYRTTSIAIARLNGITNVRSLRIGQRLTIITCNGWSSGNTYVVQSGDNLFRIALRYGTSAEAIRVVNGLPSNLISVGQVLRIP